MYIKTLLDGEEVIVSRDGIKEKGTIVRFAGAGDYLIDFDSGEQSEVNQDKIIAKMSGGAEIYLGE